MDRGSANGRAWFKAIKYYWDLQNKRGRISKDKKAPLEITLGELDLLSLSLPSGRRLFTWPMTTFSWYIPGRLLGVSESCGNALTYHILIEEETIICRSVVHPMGSQENQKLRSQPSSGASSQVHHGFLHLVAISPYMKVTSIPAVNPLYWVGKNFVYFYKGVHMKTKVSQSMRKGKLESSLVMITKIKPLYLIR